MHKSNTTFADILALSEPETDTTETRTFGPESAPVTLTIWADGKLNADRFYAMRTAMAAPIQERALTGKGPAPVVINLPNKKRVEASDPGYIALLGVMAIAGSDPQLSVQEWAALGHKVGPLVMDEIFDWATKVNGLDEWAGKQIDNAKNSLGAEAGKNGSSAPA